MHIYSRSVTVRTPKDERVCLVEDVRPLSDSLASAMALDSLSQWFARSEMAIVSVSDLAAKPVALDHITEGERSTGTQ